MRGGIDGGHCTTFGIEFNMKKKTRGNKSRKILNFSVFNPKSKKKKF